MFPRHFNVEYAWSVCRVQRRLHVKNEIERTLTKKYKLCVKDDYICWSKMIISARRNLSSVLQEKISSSAIIIIRQK